MPIHIFFVILHPEKNYKNNMKRFFTQNIKAMLVVLLVLVGSINASAEKFLFYVDEYDYGASSLVLYFNNSHSYYGGWVYDTGFTYDGKPVYFRKIEDSMTTVQFTVSSASTDWLTIPYTNSLYNPKTNTWSEVTVNLEAPQTVCLGKSINISAKSNVIVPDECKFSYSSDGTNFKDAGNDKHLNTWSFTPTKTGTYYFKVNTITTLTWTDSRGDENYETLAINSSAISVNVVDPTVTLEASSTSVDAGTEITLTTNTDLCNFSPINYTYSYSIDGGKTYTEISSGSSSTLKYIPTKAATYMFKVTASDGTNSLTSETISVESKSVAGYITFTATPTTVYTNSPITLTALAVCTQVETYYFYRIKDVRSEVLEYDGPNNTCTYTPDKAGTYTFFMFVDYANGTVSDRMYCEVTVVDPPTQTITPNANGVLSCVADYPLDFSSVNGLEAFAATSVSSTNIKLKKVDKVLKGEAFVVKGSANTDYAVPSTMEFSHESGYRNLFQAADGTKTASEYGSYVYCLSTSGVFKQVDDDVVIPANKAYLLYTSSNAKGFTLDFGEATGVEVVRAERPQDSAVYNILGQRVNANAKGMIIKNGKKYFNKLDR